MLAVPKFGSSQRGAQCLVAGVRNGLRQPARFWSTDRPCGAECVSFPRRLVAKRMVATCENPTQLWLREKDVTFPERRTSYHTQNECICFHFLHTKRVHLLVRNGDRIQTSENDVCFTESTLVYTLFNREFSQDRRSARPEYFSREGGFSDSSGNASVQLV